MFKKLISKFYNEFLEDVSTRILYFFNTVDTYFLIAGIASFIFYGLADYNIASFLIITFAVLVIFKIADFYPLFCVFSPVFLFFLFKSPHISLSDASSILLLNTLICIIIQFLFMGIPSSIVARDLTVGIRMIWNSIFTIAPTTVSLPISVYFSTLFALTLIARPSPLNGYGFMFWLTIYTAAFVAYFFKPRPFISADSKPEIKAEFARKAIVLNIDGCRLDRFYEAGLPFLTSFQKESSYFPKGLWTIYRALTNPAFASILTGTVPKIHGIKNNNLGQSIRVEALPDLVKTKLYGCMHVKHFSKPHWDTKIVSLPTHGIYKSDDVMFDWLKGDLIKEDGTRLFIADISELDFLGHAYGSESKQYFEALKRTDIRIGRFFQWLKKNDFLKDSVLIICSDHGIAKIDHSYLLFKAERYVPFMILGGMIKGDNPLSFEASIMDIAPTICYLLGVKYPINCKGRSLVEI